jgi:hypothetical protein
LVTPGIFRLINVDHMTSRNQLGTNATKKVGISMIPIGNQRMTEDDYIHVDGRELKQSPRDSRTATRIRPPLSETPLASPPLDESHPQSVLPETGEKRGLPAE